MESGSFEGKGPKYWEFVEMLEVSMEGGVGAAAEFDRFGLILISGRKGGGRLDSDLGKCSCGIQGWLGGGAATPRWIWGIKSEFEAKNQCSGQVFPNVFVSWRFFRAKFPIPVWNRQSLTPCCSLFILISQKVTKDFMDIPWSSFVFRSEWRPVGITKGDLWDSSFSKLVTSWMEQISWNDNDSFILTPITSGMKWI